MGKRKTAGIQRSKEQLLVTAAKMYVMSNNDSLTEIGKYFAILIFTDSY